MRCPYDKSTVPGNLPNRRDARRSRKVGWACGYALSIFGTEYYQQCPFQSGNGYGDGRAKQIGAAIRAHLATGQPAVSDALRAAIPSAAEIRAKVAQVLEKEINPSVAAHGGRFPDTRFYHLTHSN